MEKMRLHQSTRRVRGGGHPRPNQSAALEANLVAVRAQSLAGLDAAVDDALDVALQAAAKVLEHGGAAREHNVLFGGEISG